MRDRLWFFTSGRLRDESQGRTLIATAVPYEFREEQRRYEVKGTYSLTPKHRFQVNYNHHDRSQINYSFNQNLTMDLRSLGTRKLPERLYAGTYSGMLTSKLFVEAMVSKRTLEFHRRGRQVDRSHRRHAAHRQQPAGGARWWSDTFCGVCTPEGRDSEDVFVKGSYFLSTPRFGSHNLVFGYDTFNDIRTRQQSPVGQRLPHPERGRDPHAAAAPARTTSSRSSSATAPRRFSGTRSSRRARARTSARTRGSSTTPGASAIA